MNARIPLINTFCLLLALIFFTQLEGQKYLQLERSNSFKVKRYQEGDEIKFRMNTFEDNWFVDPILELLPAEKSIVFYDKIIQIDEITHIQYNRRWANLGGKSLMSFGASWLAFGGAIEGLRRLDVIDTEYTFGTDTAIIGVTSIASGWLVQKLWSKATKKINDRNRLRILDLNF